MKYQIKRDEKMRKRRPKSKSGTTIYTFVMFAALAALIAVLAVAYVQGCEARLSKELQTTDTEEPLTAPPETEPPAAEPPETTAEETTAEETTLLPIDEETDSRYANSDEITEEAAEPASLMAEGENAFDPTLFHIFADETARFFPAPAQSAPDGILLNRGGGYAQFIMYRAIRSRPGGDALGVDENGLILIPENDVLAAAERYLGDTPQISDIFVWPFGEPADGFCRYNPDVGLPAADIASLSSNIDEDAGEAVAIAEMGDGSRLVYRYKLVSGSWRLTAIDEG
jgi:hypothetical protein